VNIFKLWNRHLTRRARPSYKRKPILFGPRLEVLEDRTLLSSSLVAAYNFAQGSGAVLNDVSGNGNNGALNDATWSPSYSSTLPFATTLWLNGKSDSKVSVPDSSSLNLTTAMTLEAWVDPRSLSSVAAVIAKDNPNSSNDVGYALYAANGSGTPAAGILSNGSDNGVQGSSPLPLNTWTFLAAAYDGSTLKMYVNGQLASSQALSGSISPTSDPLYLGGNWDGETFAGEIANVRIYNTALSQSAIQTDMSTPIVAATDTAPTVTSVTPANNASAVSTSTAVTIQFSEALDPTTVNSSTIQLLNSSGQAVAASVRYNSSTDTATVTASVALANSSTYTILIHGGTSGYVVLDSAGTPLAANFSSSFTTIAPGQRPQPVSLNLSSPQAQNLVADFPLWVANPATSTLDYGPHGLVGTPSNILTYNDPVMGPVFLGDGTTRNYMVPYNTYTDFAYPNDTAQAFSLSAWVNISIPSTSINSQNNPPNMYMVTMDANNGAAYPGYGFGVASTLSNNGPIVAEFDVDGHEAQATMFGTKPLNDGQWHLIVATYTPDLTFGSVDRVGKIYVDGVLDSTSNTMAQLESPTVAPANTLRNPVAMYLGTDDDGHSSPFQGMFCDLRFYSGALTATQIAAMYAPATRWDLYTSTGT
jgi:methionine-rich copper-binding protein CopC